MKNSSSKEWNQLQSLSDLELGFPIIHVDHGIGLYQGLIKLKLQDIEQEFLLIEYANKDKLYLPVYRLNLVQRYQGGADSVSLDRLGSPSIC